MKKREQPSGREPLRFLLQEKSEGLMKEVLKSEGHVSKEDLEGLERLAKLVELSEGAESRRSRRWPVVAVLLSTLLVVSILCFARVSETEIELDTQVSAVSFVTSGPGRLTERLSLITLGVSGLQEIHLPQLPGREWKIVQSEDREGAAVRISGQEGRQAAITLEGVTVPGGTEVRTRWSEILQQCRLTLKGDNLKLQATLQGPILAGLAGAPVEKLEFASPKGVNFLAGPEEVDVDLWLARKETVFAPQIRVEKLRLIRVDQFSDTGRTVVQRVSTILAGNLYLEALSGQKRELRPGERLEFAWSRGEIRSLQMNDNHMTVKFHGSVRSMTTGSEANRRSLMPTYLEWLQARHGLSLLWGATLYLFGLLVVVLRWWGVKL